MNVVTLLILNIIHHITGSCMSTLNFTFNRNVNLQTIKYIGAVNFVFDYEFIQEVKGSNIIGFLKFLRKPNSVMDEPLLFIEFYERSNVFDFKGHSNHGFGTHNEHKFISKEDINFENEFLKNENCSDNVKHLVWKLKINKPFSLLLLACQVKYGKKAFIATKRIILISDKFPNSNITTNFKFITQKFNLENEFDQRYCFCDHLNKILNSNECGSKNDKVAVGIFIVIYAFMIFVFLLFEVYLYVVKKSNLNNQIHSIEYIN